MVRALHHILWSSASIDMLDRGYRVVLVLEHSLSLHVSCTAASTCAARGGASLDTLLDAPTRTLSHGLGCPVAALRDHEACG